MRKYEMMVIYGLDSAAMEESKKFVKDFFDSNDISLMEEKDFGIRELAYGINGKKRGHYYIYTYEADQKVFPEMNRTFKLHNGIMRYINFVQES